MAKLKIDLLTDDIIMSCDAFVEIAVGDKVKVTLNGKNPLWPSYFEAEVSWVKVDPVSSFKRHYIIDHDDAVLNGGPEPGLCDIKITAWCCCDALADTLANMKILTNNGDGTITVTNPDGSTFVMDINSDDAVAIQQEVARAKAKEDDLQEAIAAEKLAREQEDAVLAQSIVAETTRATTAEGILTSGLAAEIIARETEDEALDQAITVLENGVVRHDIPQALTPTQQTQALNNLGTLPVSAAEKNKWDGNASAIVFDTESDLNAWLLNPANTATLHPGDVFYIKDPASPDYWWDGVQKIALEEKTDLSNYFNKDETAVLLLTKAEKSTTVTGSGLATGGGTLDSSVQINVQAATEAEMGEGLSTTTVPTPNLLAKWINIWWSKARTYTQQWTGKNIHSGDIVSLAALSGDENQVPSVKQVKSLVQSLPVSLHQHNIEDVVTLQGKLDAKIGVVVAAVDPAAIAASAPTPFIVNNNNDNSVHFTTPGKLPIRLDNEAEKTAREAEDSILAQNLIAETNRAIAAESAIQASIAGYPAVKYDASQPLTDVQKTQARVNIGAVSASEIPAPQPVPEPDWGMMPGTAKILKAHSLPNIFVNTILGSAAIVYITPAADNFEDVKIAAFHRYGTDRISQDIGKIEARDAGTTYLHKMENLAEYVDMNDREISPGKKLCVLGCPKLKFIDIGAPGYEMDYVLILEGVLGNSANDGLLQISGISNTGDPIKTQELIGKLVERGWTITIS